MGKPKIGLVKLTFYCTHCGTSAAIKVRWSRHHTIPKGWRSRDAVPSPQLPRRTDHIFACSNECITALDKRFPVPDKIRWFKFS